MCNEMAEWSNENVECRRISCGRWPVVLNSEPGGGEALFGDHMAYECSLGYDLDYILLDIKSF